MTSLPTATDTALEDWLTWHREHERRRAAPHGFLAVTAIHWLDETPRAYRDAPGLWSSVDGVPRVELPAGERLLIDGRAVGGTVEFAGIDPGDSVYADWGAIRLEIGERTKGYVLRPRSPENRLLVEYPGTPVFAYDPRWVITGRFTPAAAPARVSTDATTEGVRNDYVSPGTIDLEVDGIAVTALPFVAKDGRRLRLVFRDRTSGVTTWEANRNVEFDAPDADGLVRVDFNRAWNLPCAYIDQATCPIPPRQNVFPFAVEAGEKTPLQRQTL